ncbi:MBL fold metallo-hydrolase [Desulfopila sp. IMCC35008]|uniref:MBL fold metallo-hydrolase n=1 Tax=Desulfopila sp. IMCC35008 TaxID=2653858 RepID=UPI0013D57780|nr:MBL fold metallo-hydrolase [Desulfopila sp. IMCC35008]
MSIFVYTASELYNWLIAKENMILLDVRNDKDFARFQVEAPYPFEMINVSYYDFMEIEDECIARIPRDKPVRVICAKEGSAKYVAEILHKNGYDDIGYLQDGIKSWGNMLVPMLLNSGEKYEMYQFIRPGKASCSYGLVVDGEMRLFDPSRNTDFYLNFAKEKECKIVQTFETHLQADYIAGSRMLMEATGAEFMANENDFSGARFDYTKLKDNQVIRCGTAEIEIRVIFTPGHTPGSTSYLVDNRFLITGDAVFLQSVGRPDLGGKVDEWSNVLFATLQDIQKMDKALLILPGHYIDWHEANDKLCFCAPLGTAIEHNKNIYAIDNKADFLAFIKANMREQPEEYTTIRLINANIEQVENDKAEELDLGKNECAASAYAAQQAENK